MSAKWLWPAALVLVACDCEGGNVLGKVRPVLVVEPIDLPFGEVPLGATKRIYVRIGNQGSAELTLGPPDAPSPFFALLSATTVAPGGQVTLDVGFRPQNDEAQSGVLNFATNDPDHPNQAINLSGKGVAGAVTLRPPTVDLSNTSVGAERGVELVLDNLGLGPVSGRLVTEGFARPEHWSLSTLASVAQPGAFTIEARSQGVYDLRYRPLAAGEDPGVVRYELCGDRCGLEVQVVATARQPSLILEPPALNFGDQGIGESRTKQLVAHNIGGEPVEIREVRRAGGAEWTAAPPRGLPFTLAPGDSAAINVTFTPLSASEVTGEIIVVNSDPTTPEIRASLRGQGAGPRFEVVPNPITFGIERAAGTYRRTVLMLNSGSSEVQVTNAELVGDPELTLGPLPGWPARLLGGESLPLDVVFQPTQIGEYQATLRITTNDAASPMVEIPVTGGMADVSCEVTLSPERINFGSLPPGHHRRRTARLTNVGDSPCNFLSGAFRAPVDPALTVVNPPWPTVLAPGQFLDLELEYAPTQPVESKGNLTLLTDDVVFPERHLALAGTARQDTRVFVEPPSLDFGGLSVGCAAGRRTTTLYNLGNTDVHLDAVNYTGSSDFQVVLGTPLSATVPAGSTYPIGVDFLTADAGRDDGELEIIVRDQPYAFVVPVTGEGLQDQRTSEVFVQGRNDKVDILFVIDDSCSMADDQQAVANNFGDFINQAAIRSVDFQIGVTTTTLFPTAGLLVGPVLRPGTPSLELVFASLVNVGTFGSGVEQGLDAMAGALSLADQGVAPNVGLLRSDAIFAVVLVSDEDDQSQLAPTFYYGDVNARFSAKGYVTAAVTGGSFGCLDTTGLGSASPAPRYLEFLRLTGGFDESICNDWASTLANLGSAVFGLRTQFPLSSLPDMTEPIIVTIDGVPAAAGSWTYDPVGQAVVFTTPPPEGSTVIIDYLPTC